VEVSLTSELPGEGKMHGVRNCRVLAPAPARSMHQLGTGKSLIERIVQRRFLIDSSDQYLNQLVWSWTVYTRGTRRQYLGNIACKEKSDMRSTELSVGDCVQARMVTQGALSITEQGYSESGELSGKGALCTCHLGVLI
jgi:hypothetical protein